MEITMTDILMVVLVIIVGVVSRFVVPLLRAKYGSETQEQLLAIVMTAVEAAEQIFGGGTGKTKKEYVLEYLNSKGFNVDEKTLDNMIEACVLEINRESAG